MKASESVSNFAPTLRMYTNFAVRTVKKVCSEIGPRECGSEAELKAQNYMAQQVGDAADEVKQDEFKVAPRAFLGWIKIAGIMLTVATAITFFNLFVAPGTPYSAIINVVVSALILIMFLGEFLFYKETIDAFFPKATSHNTYCIRHAEGEVKRRIILAGHSDSSIEWLPTHIGGRGMLYFGFAYPIVGWVFLTLISILMLVKGGTNQTLILISGAFVPGYVILMNFLNYNICVDGANDNLSGCVMGAAVLKFMQDNDIRFKNTEVIAMFSGGEESGLRGAKASVKQHPEFKDPNVETVFVGFDTVKDYDDMAIYNRDMTGTVKHDDRSAALVKEAGKRIGLELNYALLFCGSSDAAAMTQGGIPSICFAAMNPGPPKYYHTRDDKADIMEMKTMEKGVELALETAFLFDEQGLKKQYD